MRSMLACARIHTCNADKSSSIKIDLIGKVDEENLAQSAMIALAESFPKPAQMSKSCRGAPADISPCPRD
jgi:hypothetical protein